MLLRFYSLWPWILKVSRRDITHGFCSFANPPLQPAFRGEAKATALTVGAHGLTQPWLPELPSHSWRIILAGSSSFAAFKESTPEGVLAHQGAKLFWVSAPSQGQLEVRQARLLGLQVHLRPFFPAARRHFKARSHCGLRLNPLSFQWRKLRTTERRWPA